VFEYLVIDIPKRKLQSQADPGKLTQELNQLGSEGWPRLSQAVPRLAVNLALTASPNGKELAGKAAGAEILTFDPNGSIAADDQFGSAWKFTLPGAGVVLQFVGHRDLITGRFSGVLTPLQDRHRHRKEDPPASGRRPRPFRAPATTKARVPRALDAPPLPGLRPALRLAALEALPRHRSVRAPKICNTSFTGTRSPRLSGNFSSSRCFRLSSGCERTWTTFGSSRRAHSTTCVRTSRCFLRRGAVA
jgi:hypothetical protein